MKYLFLIVLLLIGCSEPPVQPSDARNLTIMVSGKIVVGKSVYYGNHWYTVKKISANSVNYGWRYAEIEREDSLVVPKVPDERLEPDNDQ